MNISTGIITVNLTEEQSNVAKHLLSFKKRIQTMGGYAGTGKTHLVSHLNKTLGDWAVCAFTGKATNVLRKRGIENATTIHSLIYAPELDFQGNMITDSYGNPTFSLKDDIGCSGIIVDEASMVSKDLYIDLQSFGKSIIFVGDHGQLEPVGRDLNLMESPDVVLEVIHRNAGEIAKFAEFIRKGHHPPAYRHKYPESIEFIKKKDMKKSYKDVDQIICAYNKTRVEVNREVRAILGHDPSGPVKDERIMCLRNNSTKGLFNGMQGKIISFGKRKNRIVFYSDDNWIETTFDPNSFGQEKPEFSMSRDDPDPFEYAYCTTCHKAQGDEWDRVMVIEQVCKNWDHSRWAYTAASRAKSHLKWAY